MIEIQCKHIKINEQIKSNCIVWIVNKTKKKWIERERVVVGEWKNSNTKRNLSKKKYVVCQNVDYALGQWSIEEGKKSSK